MTATLMSRLCYYIYSDIHMCLFLWNVFEYIPISVIKVQVSMAQYKFHCDVK